MKYTIICLFMATGLFANAQTPPAGPQPAKQSRKANTATQKPDTRTQAERSATPGSPVGTGGAGGGDMSGSPAGSAIETHDQTDKVVPQNNTGNQTQMNAAEDSRVATGTSATKAAKMHSNARAGRRKKGSHATTHHSTKSNTTTSSTGTTSKGG